MGTPIPFFSPHHDPSQDIANLFLLYFIYLVIFGLFRDAPGAYGGSQAKGLIGAVAAGLRHSHSHSYSNTKSKPCLQPTSQLMATLDP